MGIPTGFSLDVVLRLVHLLHFPSWLASHIRAFVNKAMTQNEVKPQEGSIRDQQELVKPGGNQQTEHQQASKARLPHGQTQWKARESRAGLLCPTRLAFFHSHSSHIPALPPSCAVGRLLGGVNTACSAAPTRTIPEQDGAGKDPAGRAGWMDKAKFSHVPLAVPQRLMSFREHRQQQPAPGHHPFREALS